MERIARQSSSGKARIHAWDGMGEDKPEPTARDMPWRAAMAEGEKRDRKSQSVEELARELARLDSFLLVPFTAEQIPDTVARAYVRRRREYLDHLREA